jgi:hypothetical protein
MIFRLILIFSMCTSLKYNLSIDASKTEELSDKINITGHWEGTLTRDEGGGKRTIFPMQLDILQKKKDVTGISYVGFENEGKKYYAKFDVEGKISSSYFKFVENKILNADSIPQAAWCIKKGELIHRKPKSVETLEGIWEGVSSLGSCMPGRIFLEKKPPRV